MKILTGVVISPKMEKSATVRVDRMWRHPIYKKMMKRSKKFLVHAESPVKAGEIVKIAEIKPMSKLKRWRIIEEAKNKEQKTKNKKQERK
ncbi:30S ribosomal protein S17 [Candidatus Collierbacteria bacterium]|nr:30S ribosomal protein S17 [Candidatus Collierbacteria bacterium]